MLKVWGIVWKRWLKFTELLGNFQMILLLALV